MMLHSLSIFMETVQMLMHIELTAYLIYKIIMEVM